MVVIAGLGLVRLGAWGRVRALAGTALGTSRAMFLLQGGLRGCSPEGQYLYVVRFEIFTVNIHSTFWVSVTTFGSLRLEEWDDDAPPCVATARAIVSCTPSC